jgi:hypothetical protein
MQADDMRMRPGGSRYRWLLSPSAGVGTVLAALSAYLLALGPQGTPARDLIEAYLFVAVVAAVAAVTSAVQTGHGRSLGRAAAAVTVGTAAGGVFAMWLAVMTGNGPDEGDGFFWLTAAHVIVSLVAAVAAMLAARRLRRSARATQSAGPARLP